MGSLHKQGAATVDTMVVCVGLQDLDLESRMRVTSVVARPLEQEVACAGGGIGSRRLGRSVAHGLVGCSNYDTWGGALGWHWLGMGWKSLAVGQIPRHPDPSLAYIHLTTYGRGGRGR